MAKFTAPVPINIKWNGLELSGAVGTTYRIPDAFVEEFEGDIARGIPGGVTWITQDETSAIPTLPIAQADVSGLTASLADKFDKTGGTISGAVTVTGAATLASIVATSITATNARWKGGPWYDVKAYGATGDGTTDDTAAIQSALDAVPVGFNGSGGVVYFPPGNYRITAPLVVKSRGTRLTGAAGAYASVINPLVSFAQGTASVNAALILHNSDSGLPFGMGIENLNIRLDSITASNVNGIVWYQSGDLAHMTNVWVTSVPSAASGIRVIVDSNVTSNISDTIVWTNVYVGAGQDNGSGTLVYLQKCQEMTLVGCKFLGSISGSASTANTRTLVHLDNPRGVTLLGCATGHGLRHVLVENNDSGASTTIGYVSFYGHTFEDVPLAYASGGRCIKASGNSAALASIYVDAPRYYNTNGAGIELVNVNNSIIEARTRPVTLDANCSLNTIKTQSRSVVTDSGSQTTILGYDDLYLSSNGQPLARRTLHARVTAGLISAGGTGTVILPWGTGSFPDTNYTAIVTTEHSASNAGSFIAQITIKSTTSIRVSLKNNDSASRAITVNAIGIAD